MPIDETSQKSYTIIEHAAKTSLSEGNNSFL